MEPYQYKPLNLEVPAFRLVRICRGEIDDDMYCELIQADFNKLESKRTYEALSYTWGKQEKEEEITLDGQSLAVTKNLWAALLHLRLEHQDRIMWIDAICIDQSNKKERGHQVQQMADVYKGAEQVIIWLGNPTWHVEILMDVMKHVEARTGDYASLHWETSDHRWSELWLEATKSAEKPEAILRSGLEVLFGRSWWRRVWILQEVANAKSARVVCGRHSVSAAIFAIVAPLLIKAPRAQCRAVLDLFPGPIRKSSWWSQEKDLRTLLHKFNESEASDPRDKIYALLGLSSDAYNTRLLVANYDHSIEEVLMKTIRFLLRSYTAVNTIHTIHDLSPANFLTYLTSLSTTVLHGAIDRGDESEVRLLLETGSIDINAVDGWGRTPLYSAALLHHQTIVSLFLAQDTAERNPVDALGRTLLSRLAERSNISMLALILEHAAMHVYSFDSDGRTPLWYAIENQDLQIVKLLVERGGFKDDRILTKSDFAAAHSSIKHAMQTKCGPVVLALLEAAGSNWTDEDGRAPLAIAAAEGDDPLLRMLLSRQDVDANTRSNHDQTPLMYAAKEGHITALRLLSQDERVDVNAQDIFGFTALHFAAKSSRERAVETLLCHKDIQIDLKTKDNQNVNLEDGIGRTALSYAAAFGHVHVVQHLLSKDDVQADSKCGSGKTPLLWSASSPTKLAWKCKVFDMLLSRNDVDVNSGDIFGNTPLSSAAVFGELKVANILLRGDDVNPDPKDRILRTPLSYAAEYGQKDVVSRLLEEDKVQADSKCIHGRTPLAWAVHAERLEVVKVLTERSDVNVHSCDNNGFTPISIARGYIDKYTRRGTQWQLERRRAEAMLDSMLQAK